MAINKMGRPKVEKPKKCHISTYIDDEMYNDLLSYCESKNVNIACAVREALGFLLYKKE